MEIQLSERMKKIVSTVKSCNRVIDIGCDHGLMSMALAERGDILRVLATDISSSSLEKLIESKKELPKNIQSKITVKVSDGFLDIDEKEIDVILIAGMGGERMINILSQEPEIVKNAKQLVLSPHSRTDLVRKYLYENNLAIVSEELIYEDFYYEIINVDPSLYNNLNKGCIDPDDTEIFQKNVETESDNMQICSQNVKMGSDNTEVYLKNAMVKLTDVNSGVKYDVARIPGNQMEWEYGTYLLDKHDRLQIDRLKIDVKKNEKILKTISEAENSEKTIEKKNKLIKENEWRREWIKKMEAPEK